VVVGSVVVVVGGVVGAVVVVGGVVVTVTVTGGTGSGAVGSVVVGVVLVPGPAPESTLQTLAPVLVVVPVDEPPESGVVVGSVA
jgi:hypothetical protein